MVEVNLFPLNSRFCTFGSSPRVEGKEDVSRLYKRSNVVKFFKRNKHEGRDDVKALCSSSRACR